MCSGNQRCPALSAATENSSVAHYKRTRESEKDPCDPSENLVSPTPTDVVPVTMTDHNKLGYKTSADEQFLTPSRTRREAEKMKGNGPIELEPTPGFEPGTFSLPRKCWATYSQSVLR